MGEGEEGGGETDEGGYGDGDYIAVAEGEYWVEVCEEGGREVWVVRGGGGLGGWRGRGGIFIVD